MGRTIFRNKQWHVYLRDVEYKELMGTVTVQRLAVESRTRAFVDWPIKYPDGRIAYDFPERVPEYIKKKVGAYFAGRI